MVKLPPRGTGLSKLSREKGVILSQGSDDTQSQDYQFLYIVVYGRLSQVMVFLGVESSDWRGPERLNQGSSLLWEVWLLPLQDLE